MKKFVCHILLFVGLLFSFLCTRAQPDPDKVCRIENGQLIFSLNLKWTEQEKKQVSELFDLDSTLIAQVYSGKTIVVADGETWKVKKVQPYLVELSKSVEAKADKKISINDLFLVIDKWMNFNGKGTENSIVYGINKLEVSNAFVYSSQTARFYLHGYQSARKVYISGTFNN